MENTKELISKIRNEIDLNLRDKVRNYTNTDDVIDSVLEIIDEIISENTSNTIEQSHEGKWIEHSHNLNTMTGIFRCSECGRTIAVDLEDDRDLTEEFPFCHCGAKMIEVD